MPGVLAVARTRDGRTTAALTTTARVRGWLEAHDDEAGIPRIWRGEIAGEVATQLEADGYEVNATFPPDRRPVDAGGGRDRDPAARLGPRRPARDRPDAVDSWEGAHGPLPDGRGARRAAPGRGAAPRRRVRGVARGPAPGRRSLRRAAGRRAGTGRAGGVAGVGRGSPRRRWAGTTTAPRPPDRHGETWTLAKVLRRIQAHGFDHLWELERRLVRVDGTARPASRSSSTGSPRRAGSSSLLRSVGWDLRASEPASLERALRGTTEFATAWDGDRLIGTARSITDGSQNALIATVVVDPAYQGLGVGERMMHLLTDGRELVRFSLAAAPGLEPWYRKLGFLPGLARAVPAAPAGLIVGAG